MLDLIKTYKKVIFSVLLVAGYALGVVSSDQMIGLLGGTIANNEASVYHQEKMDYFVSIKEQKAQDNLESKTILVLYDSQKA